jgi:MEDS: MEthanogen/methylotroph, DcmR Sensory domain
VKSERAFIIRDHPIFGQTAMPVLLSDLAQLPTGSHCLSLHTDGEEAADHAVAFLAGTPEGQAAAYWVADSSLQAYYEERLAEEAPTQVGCVLLLSGEQVHVVDGKLRPVDEVRQFVAAHPEGVTGAGETLSIYWLPDNVPDHLEYEAWFDGLPRDRSRFLCPYDLRRVPSEDAPGILRELGRHHSHVVLSPSHEPAVRLLQLFVFETPAEVPFELSATLEWAIDSGFVEEGPSAEELRLTRVGAEVVHDWGQVTSIDW